MGSGLKLNDFCEEFEEVMKELIEDEDIGLARRSLFFIGGSWMRALLDSLFTYTPSVATNSVVGIQQPVATRAGTESVLKDRTSSSGTWGKATVTAAPHSDVPCEKTADTRLSEDVSGIDNSGCSEPRRVADRRTSCQSGQSSIENVGYARNRWRNGRRILHELLDVTAATHLRMLIISSTLRDMGSGTLQRLEG
jgi:hypothetical protein